MNLYIFGVLFFITSALEIKAQNIWAKPSYTDKDITINIGSGAFIRHLEPNYLNGSYNNYIKSPFIVAGLDYCFASKGDAWWGVGPYLSGALGRKEISGSNNGSKEYWYDGLAGIKFFHHNKYFVTEKFDLCSGYIIGARLKRSERSMNNDESPVVKNTNSVNLAVGISVMIKYYFSKNTAIYAEGGLGYKVDLFHFGLCFRMENRKLKH